MKDDETLRLIIEAKRELSYWQGKWSQYKTLDRHALKNPIYVDAAIRNGYVLIEWDEEDERLLMKARRRFNELSKTIEQLFNKALNDDGLAFKIAVNFCLKIEIDYFGATADWSSYHNLGGRGPCRITTKEGEFKDNPAAATRSAIVGCAKQAFSHEDFNK